MEVVLYAALTLDGRLTRHDEEGTPFVSAADQAFLREELAQCDSSIMGARTYALYRETIRARQPEGRRRLIWTRNPADWHRDTIAGSLEFTATAPTDLIAELHRDGRRRCALLGGTQAYTAFLKEGLVDALWLTYEPRLVGTGLPLLQLPVDLPCHWQESRTLGIGTHAHHYRLRP